MMTTSAPFLIIAHDVVGPRVAGPGIRALELARALSADGPVICAVPHGEGDIRAEGVTIHHYQPGDWASLAPAVERCRALLINPFSLLEFPALDRSGKAIAIDLYDPFLLENLHHQQLAPAEERRRVHARDVALLQRALAVGDFFLCANRRQRDAWLGALMVAGRVTPALADSDPTLTSLLDEVGFGLPDAPFASTGRGPREHFPTLQPDDRLILWGGGLWDWLDPLTAIRALPLVLREEPKARLLFPGTRHPNPAVPLMQRTQEAMQLADALGLAGREVLFGEWVPYEDWPAFLGQSDMALTLHHESLETRLAAVRSRVLGYIWAGVPIVAGDGDAASDLVREHGLGEVVPCGDAEATAAALVRMLRAGRAPYHAAFDALRPTLTWHHLAVPLRRFARDGRPLPDKAPPQVVIPPPAAQPALGQRVVNWFRRSDA